LRDIWVVLRNGFVIHRNDGMINGDFTRTRNTYTVTYFYQLRGWPCSIEISGIVGIIGCVYHDSDWKFRSLNFIQQGWLFTKVLYN
jgi:hypothetical protein